MTIPNFVAGALFLGAALSIATPSSAQQPCTGFGPQTPRDISSAAGANQRAFTLAPAASRMNLCNIHTHTNAEHKGPGFSVFADTGLHGRLSKAEMVDPAKGHGAFHGVKPGDTIEVHWV
jgi:hypothetical protein